jgi:hypothetical protein
VIVCAAFRAPGCDLISSSRPNVEPVEQSFCRILGNLQIDTPYIVAAEPYLPIQTD